MSYRFYFSIIAIEVFSFTIIDIFLNTVNDFSNKREKGVVSPWVLPYIQNGAFLYQR